MYFANFPSIVYDATGNFDFKVVTNLLRRVALRQKIRDNVLVFDTYDVGNGETPEMLADKLYGESELHWIILLLNNVTDRYHQWPKSYTQWLSFLEDKYPTVSGASTQLIDQVHHFEIAQTSGNTTTTINIGTTDTTPDFSATSVTNYEYEEKIQDDLGQIRLLDPSYIPVFIEEFEKLMEESII
jgi:hypothetical protein